LQPLDDHLFEGSSEVPPRQVVTIVQVDDQVKQGFNIVSPRLIVTTAGVQGSEHEISGEVCQVFLLYVFASFAVNI
jgi:hypothetical protein